MTKLEQSIEKSKKDVLQAIQKDQNKNPLTISNLFHATSIVGFKWSEHLKY